MAEISLRQYVQQIDDIIEDSDQLEEAIAHCRHILKSFPKHIDTYRLLGKAYLESKRYGDAADIFQRVLSAVPDDFVSHVGMAIIREDEGNLDAAIWHMERSSESKPGNAAIEQELKRLIGKRDGLEPQRVRPTRGALARMYSHGELYSYATTELRKALEEDPDRPDLQVLLANTYWRTDQRLEAAKLCSLILEKLPYCRDANRITAALLHETGKTEQAKSNLRRLISLDPYFAHLKNPMDDPLSVETSSILVKRITWSSGHESLTANADQPDWATSLGVDLKGDDSPAEFDENIPEWLKTEDQPKSDGEPEAAPTVHPFEGAPPPPTGEDIPQWMQEAGWGSDVGPETAGSVDRSPSKDYDDDPDGLAAAEFPDWLTEITATDQDGPQISSAEPDERPSEHVDEPFEDRTGFEVEERSQDNFGFETNVPEKNHGGSEISENDDGTEPAMSMPENFFEEGPGEEPQGEIRSDSQERSSTTAEGKDQGGTQELPPWLEPATPGASDTIVTWLGDKSGDFPPAPADDIPTWMRGTGPLIESSRADRPKPVAPPAKTEPSFEEQESSMDFRVQEETQPTEDLVAEDTQTPASQADSKPASLEGLADLRQSAAAFQEIEPATDRSEDFALEDDPLFTAAEDSEEAPEWSQPAEILDPDLQVAEAQGEEPPDWLKTVIGKDSEDEIPADDVQTEWLQGLSDEGSEQESSEDQAIQESPNWLTESLEDQTTEPVGEQAQPEWLQTLSESPPQETKEPTPGEETAPEWLTEMEALEPALEEDGAIDAVPTESVLEEMPLRDAVEAIIEEPIEETTIVTSEDDPQGEMIQRTIEGPETEAIAPDWLQDLTTTELVDVDEPVAEQSQEPVRSPVQPDWLQEMEADGSERSSETPDLQAAEPGVFQERTQGVDKEVPREAEFAELDAQEDEASHQSDAQREIENRLEWLKESAQDVTPEPELGAKQQQETPFEEIEGPFFERSEMPMDEEEVYGFLDGLASKHAVEIEEIPIFAEESDAKDGAVESEVEADPVDKQTETHDDLPEDYAAGLEWLEQLASEDEYEDVIAPDFQTESDKLGESDVPDWLEEVAEQSEEADQEADQEADFGGALRDEDPSILDTIVGKKFDLAMEKENQPKSAVAPSSDGMDFVELEIPFPSSEVEDLDSPREEIVESLPGEAEAETDVYRELQAEQFKPISETAEKFYEITSPGQLDIARSSLQDGDLEKALDYYTRLIDQKKEIDSVINDLKAAVDNTPMSPTLWQTLGDAYMQEGQVTEAINAYRKGMEAV